MAKPRNSSKDAVYVEDVLCKRETEKALLVLIDGEDKWIPKSVIHEDSEVWRAWDEGTLAMMAWFAEKEQLT